MRKGYESEFIIFLIGEWEEIRQQANILVTKIMMQKNLFAHILIEYAGHVEGNHAQYHDDNDDFPNELYFFLMFFLK